MQLDEEECQKKVREKIEEGQNYEYDLIQKAKSYYFNFYEYDSAEESEERIRK